MTADRLPPPTTIKRGIKMSVALIIFGLAIAIVPALRMPGIVIALVFAGIGLMGWRNLKRVEARGEGPTVVAPPMADGAKMFEVLAMLDVPIDMGTTDPMSALRSGAAKAGLYHGYNLLMSGKEAEAMSALQSVAGGSNGRISAAAHYLIGKHHAGKGQREQASAAYREALKLAPDYQLASAALGGTENS